MERNNNKRAYFRGRGICFIFLTFSAQDHQLWQAAQWQKKEKKKREMPSTPNTLVVVLLHTLLLLMSHHITCLLSCNPYFSSYQAIFVNVRQYHKIFQRQYCTHFKHLTYNNIIRKDLMGNHIWAQYTTKLYYKFCRKRDILFYSSDF